MKEALLRLLLLMFFISFNCSGLAVVINPAFSINSDEAQKMGMLIWKNECGAKQEGLTSWNKGEEFASVGIGHFIWYPPGKQGPFKEMFPSLLIYLQKHGILLPEWLKIAQGCPWQTRQVFLDAQESTKMKEFRQLLVEHIDLQICFMVERLSYALPVLLKHAKLEKQDQISKQFHRLAQTSNGLFVLLDYLNFKGEGISFQECYQGQGWGLLQVLERMQGSEQGKVAIEEFVCVAKEILKLRVQNAPIARGEQRWLKGWCNRIDSYLQVSLK
ncbi:hypothetical protein [Candidatus Protochlamydia sp. W-9]|uniref:hypothetical protein n=1 Tax=Candidatus Protochlamydia sp. W-9 TaxID=1785087 RepID=UPI00096A6EF8|nr:hypothetical protein [Candidatus Protochlamydia sp. W-9]